MLNSLLSRFLVFLVLFLSSTVLMPAFAVEHAATTEHQAPQAPYAVGVKTLFIHDESRPFDVLGGVTNGVRSLLTEVWYPVDHASLALDQSRQQPRYERATFGDYVFGRRDVHQKMMTQTTFFHLTPDTVREGITSAQIQQAIDELFERPRNAYVNAPLANTDSPLPIVVMTHGDAGSRYNMESACEALAAQGYVVIAPEHTGNTPFALTSADPALRADFNEPALAAKMQEVKPFLNVDGTYGPENNYGQTYTPLASRESTNESFVELDRALVERVNDLRAALTTLEQWNAEGEFSGRLDFTRIGVMGRSFGGMTALAALGLEKRFAAGVAVVPLVFPDFRAAMPSELLVDKERETVLLNREGPVILNTVHKPTLYLSGAEDALIIGAGQRMAVSFGGPQPSQDNPHAVLRHSYETTTKPVYWGLLHNSNHSSFGVSGGYWWPDLKPNTQTRTFNSDEQFTLIAPARAHEIQEERVVRFFNAYLKHQTSDRQQLRENPFKEDGLEFEYRNVSAE